MDQSVLHSVIQCQYDASLIDSLRAYCVHSYLGLGFHTATLSHF